MNTFSFKLRKYVTGALIFTLFSSVSAQINDLVKTPPMGWNSWNVFHENINENQIEAIADVMVSSGMRDAGYIYLNLDDNWMATSRDASGNLRADPTRFPSGMKALGDYIHSKGLKFGVYGDRGALTCHHYNNNIQSQSGSYGNEVRDANTFASWGVDYLKYDNCGPVAGSNQQQDYERMRDALLNSGRAIVYSICAWGYQSWMPATGNLWRTTGDISNKWEETSDGFFHGVIDIVDLNEPYASHASPGGWNDPDMLQIGNGVLTDNEARSHMSMWALMAAPLIAGNDIRTMSTTTKEILLNPEVIAVNQDSAGIQGTRVSATNNLEIWVKPLGSKTSSTKAVALLNRSSSAANITVRFSDVGLSGQVLVRDLWAHEDKGAFLDTFSMSVPSHGTGLLKLSIPTVPQAPYKSVIEIPGTVEAEDYDVGGLGVSYYDSDGTNSGSVYRTDGVDITGDAVDGYKVGWTVAGEWLEYSVSVKKEATYTWTARVSMGGDSAAISMTLDSVDISGVVRVPGTGSWDDYVEISGTTKVPLKSGEHVLRLNIEESYVNIDWIAFKEPIVNIASPKASPYQNNKYQVYDLQGRALGQVEGQNSRQIKSSIQNLVQKQGIYVIRRTSGSRAAAQIVNIGTGADTEK